MTLQSIAKRTVELILLYYDNQVQPFLDILDEDILWLGPAEGQMIRGREQLIQAFSAEGDHGLHFAVHDMTVIPLPTGSSRVFDVLTIFLVDTFWPDGSTNRVLQRMNFTWVIRDGKPRMRLCHISNAIAYDARDRIYPVHYNRLYQSPLPTGDAHSLHLCFRAADKSFLYLNWQHVLYAESRGRHTLIHSQDQTVEVNESLTSILRQYGSLFLRCHESYLVNPGQIRSVTRFQLRLSNGEILPVPQKKYTAFREAMAVRLEEMKTRNDGILSPPLAEP